MRHIVMAILMLVPVEATVAQSATDRNGSERSEKFTRPIRVEIQGPLHIGGRFNTAPESLTTYSKITGAEINLASNPDFPMWFELFLGSAAELSQTAKTLSGKWVIAEGELVVVHGPMRLTFGDRSGPLGRTQYSHSRPRYVIKVRRLKAAAAEASKKQTEFVRFKVEGTLQTSGTNPPLSEVYAKKASLGTIIRSLPCDCLLFLGKNNEWLARARELNGKGAIVEGDLRHVGGILGSDPTTRKPGFYFLSVTDLQSAKMP